MISILAGVEYLAAGLVGFAIAFFPTALISYVIFPPDGPIGEGFAILFIYFISCCVCVPGYAALMGLHRQDRRDTRGLIVCEIILRASFLVAACFVCFMAIMLPIAIVTKWLICLAVAPFGAWAIKRISFA